jgi:3-oxoacyl-[acyl-carrier-protein] synthase III
MTAQTVIESLGVYLPPREVSTAELIRGCRRKVRFPLERMTGIKSRRVAGDGEFAIDLAKQAIARCLATSRHAPADVDLLISAAIGRVDHAGFMVSYEPSTALRLKRHFGFRRALAFDVRSACSGMWVGVNIADTLLRQGVIGCALIVSGEYITHLAATAQLEIDGLLDRRLACLTLGDAGAAVTLEAGDDSRAGFTSIDLRTFGDYADCCVAGPTDQSHGGAIMHTDALRLTDAAARHGGEHALGALRRAGWDYDGFQHLIMHQTSRTALTSATRAINRLLKRPVCHAGNTIDNLERCGNTATTTHFVALADGIASGRIRSGDRVIFAISGSGLTLGTALYTLDDLPERLRAAASAKHSNGRPARKPSPTAPCVRIASVGTAPRDTAERHDTLTLLKLAASDCLRADPASRSPDLVIYAGVYRSRFLTEPAMAALLAGELGLQGALAFDVFNGSAGMLHACHVAEQMLRDEKATSVLVVAAEHENNAAAFPSDVLGIEESGSALLLQQNGEGTDGFGHFVFRSFPEHQDEFVSYLTNRDGKAYLQFARDPEIERHYVRAIVATVCELLARTGTELAGLARIFPPQISSAFIGELAAAMAVPRDRFVDVVQDGKDLFTSSLPFALRAARQQGVVRQGDLGLIITAGSGIEVGCALYHF